MSSTVYRTKVDGEVKYEGDLLEQAIRTWDNETYGLGYSVTGGVEVHSFDAEGNMTRDGWLLHVNAVGTVYLNPNLRTV